MDKKPPVLSDEEIEKFMLKLYNSPILLVRLAEYLIQQAHQEAAREIFEEIENKHCGHPDGIIPEVPLEVSYDDWQELKSKYLEGK